MPLQQYSSCPINVKLPSVLQTQIFVTIRVNGIKNHHGANRVGMTPHPNQSERETKQND
jgi:hypothetical protein